MSGIEFNASNLNGKAKEIFEKLDAADGKSDGKINKDIWNTFAETAGGNKIKNYIEQENGIKAIGRYLSNASEQTMDKVGDYMNSLNDTNAGTKSSSISAEGDKYAPEGQKCVGGYQREDGTWQYWYVDKEKWEAKRAAENSVMEGYENQTELRKIVDKPHYNEQPVSTTDAQRKEALNYKTESGRTYAEARNIYNEIRSSVEKTVLMEQGKMGKLSFINMTIDDLERNISKAKRILQNGTGSERELAYTKTWLAKWEKELEQVKQRKENEILSNMSDSQREEYLSAQKDMEEIQNRYPNVETCLQDLWTVYNDAARRA